MFPGTLFFSTFLKFFPGDCWFLPKILPRIANFEGEIWELKTVNNNKLIFREMYLPGTSVLVQNNAWHFSRERKTSQEGFSWEKLFHELTKRDTYITGHGSASISHCSVVAHLLFILLIFRPVGQDLFLTWKYKIIIQVYQRHTVAKYRWAHKLIRELVQFF